MIKRTVHSGLIGAALALGVALPAQSADLSKQKPIEVKVALGSKGGDLVFSPKALSLEAGKLYKLELENPSKQKHYFSALRFAAAVWTRKVETKEAEIKGAIREIELLPGGEAEWFFVPVQAGTFPLKCTIPGHAEAGMVGTITVK
jgi:uncharacterized cupredoxin-like copper-binding protein